MSYILDALRRADAERERDPARGIHAQPAAALSTHAQRFTPRWVWGAACVAAVLVGVAGGWWGTQESPVAAVAVASHPVAAVRAEPAPVVVPVAAVVSPAAPRPVALATPPAVERAVTRPPLVAKAVAAPASAPAVAGVAPPSPTATAVAVAAPAAPAAPVAPAAPAAERIVAVGDLPADVQRELPKLTISGGVHSENASQRLLIVGGQVMNEGAEVAPGVVLEQIRARTAVMRYRGFKYSVPY
jgi:general secretion pathway protein B